MTHTSKVLVVNQEVDVLVERSIWEYYLVRVCVSVGVGDHNNIGVPCRTRVLAPSPPLLRNAWTSQRPPNQSSQSQSGSLLPIRQPTTNQVAYYQAGSLLPIG